MPLDPRARTEPDTRRRERAEEILRSRTHLAERRHALDERATDLEVLSSSQERMWFLHAMDPASPAYNVNDVVRLVGDIDLPALVAACADLVARHPELRVAYGADGDGAPRRRLPEATRRSPVTVVTHQRDEAALVHDFLHRPFDLADPPLVRFLIVSGGDGPAHEHLLATSVHHIAADGWSLGVLNRDLGDLYAARRGDAEPPSPPRSDFAAFAARERRWVGGSEGRAARQARHRSLDGLAAIDLPMARTRPPIPTFGAGTCEQRLPLDTVERLEGLGRRHGCSTYMLLGAAFACLLNRYSGQDDIVFGSPVANRDDADLADVVGLFVNSVVLRTDLSGRPSFTDVLQRFRASTLDALRHQRVPFEAVVDDLQPERALSHNPLFQVMFALQTPAPEYRACPEHGPSRWGSTPTCPGSTWSGPCGATTQGPVCGSSTPGTCSTTPSPPGWAPSTHG
ncbi:condensation domain-containing protein [Nocardiopsis sp. CNR-923]|uniref:condensation domain-containing protein n=1 Tax=Nocardiopsis sp. CNR-923 TaxID=1904965 RepID=UPI00096A5D0D|nr:condensation domain-containing protein [Nocardiopsis sp. CNR-923]